MKQCYWEEGWGLGTRTARPTGFTSLNCVPVAPVVVPSGWRAEGTRNERNAALITNKKCADHAGQYENNESVLSEKLTTAALAFFVSLEMSNSSDDLCWKNCPDFYRASNHCGFESCSFASCQADLLPPFGDRAGSFCSQSSLNIPSPLKYYFCKKLQQ